MNRIYNSWTFIITILVLFFTYMVNLNETFGIFPRLDFLGESAIYKDYVYTTGAILIFLINARRSYKRWSGMKVVNQIEKFRFNTPISKDRVKTVILNNSIEVVGFSVFAIALFVLSDDAFVVVFVYLVFIVDAIASMVIGVKGKKYRIGLTKKAIVAVDREVLPIYFMGLKRLTKQNQIIYFEYINDLVLDLNLNNIPIDKQDEFVEQLRTVINEEKVYFSGFDIKE